jgi:hypothetical protein
MDTYTTRIDGVNDVDIVDMGYHYSQGVAEYELRVFVIEDPNDPGIHGTAEPDSGWYYDGAVVSLKVIPDPGYYLEGWYDVNDLLVSYNKRFEVVMDSNKTFIVRFRQPTNIQVSGGPDALQQAVDAAGNGDTLIVAAGTYNGDINFRGKEIKLFSTNPDDPNVVAQTIIDCQQGGRGFTFDNLEDPNTVIDGFTIVNGDVTNQPGGAIYIGAGSSPTIANIIISDCNVTDADGGAIYIGSGGSSTIANVSINNCSVTNGNGGGIYVSANSSPSFMSCTVNNCSVSDGSGGAVFCDVNCSTIFINCTFGDNSASLVGIVLVDPTDPNITYVLSGVGGYGGGIYFNRENTSTLRRCTLNDNAANSSGGGIYYSLDCVSEVNECTFAGNSASEDGGGMLCNIDNSITVVDCNFTGNSAQYGGGLYFDPECSGEIAESVFVQNDANEDGGAIYLTDSNDFLVADCVISDNTAARGGGLYSTYSEAARIVGCTFTNNEATQGDPRYEFYNRDPNDPNLPIGPPDPDGSVGDPNYIAIQLRGGTGIAQGGGIYSFEGPGLIADCDVSYNWANTSGGGVYLAGEYSPWLKNCLITNNIAGRDGGGISVNWQAQLSIYNCTIADNNVGDPNGYGGGLYSSYEGSLEIMDSIIWGNWGNFGVKGSQIAVMNGDLPYVLPSSITISYSDVQGWRDANDFSRIDANAVFIDPDIDANDFRHWDFNTVIDDNPLFISGYYLSQIAAGQFINSPCINVGSAYASQVTINDINEPDISLAQYTTRIDGVNDVSIVDMGYHYPIELYRLTAYVVGGNGSIDFEPDGLWDSDPNSRWYNHNAEVILIAQPDPGYRVNGWYDINDVLISVNENVEVVMDSDQVFIVQYELLSKILVSGGGNAIQLAVDAAQSGDTLIVAADTYDGDINLQGKDITLVSTNPDDPNVVAMTIIDGQLSGRGFIFNGNEGPNTIIDGFTIVNGSVTGQGGGAIYVDVNSSPTIMNVNIYNSSVTGADGGAIYVDANSSPRFINCIISSCSADNGGAVHCDANSSPIFYHCTFINNSAVQVGGAMLCDPNVSITINDCNFLDNTASYGGALYCAQNSSGMMIDTILERNDANQDGGAIYLAEANDLSITDCNISYNTSRYGAGLYSLGSLKLTISGCSFNFNQAPLVFVDPNDPNTLTIGQGGGMYCFATEVLIKDSLLNHNSANTSGGGIYLAGDSEYIEIVNCLIINNLAGRDGGGISANWYAEPNIANCSFVSNAAPGTFGTPGYSGFGGGLYCSYHSNVEVIDSILWNNFALNGFEIAVATGFEFDPRPATLMISYSDIKLTPLAVLIDAGCTLWNPTDITKHTALDVGEPNILWDPETNNINDDPCFVTGSLGDHYLSHIGAGQAIDSPCIDAGSALAIDLDMTQYTTRTDELPDSRMVDMGYHYPLEKEKCRFCDLVRDGIINFKDFAILASNWLDEGCFDHDGGCEGADFTLDTYVDLSDLAFFVDCWLVEDVCAPMPNPSEWQILPHLTSVTYPFSISMTVKTSYDAWSWPVQYYFQCVYGGGHDSGWQDSNSTTYEDTGLDIGIYGYRVKAKDELGNETEWSVIAYTGTGDTTPPAPVPAIILIQAVSPNSIAMISSEVFDESGVQYYFEATTPGGHDSGWLDEPNYTDVNLVPDTTYCYRVMARDTSTNYNTTIWSPQVCTATPLPPDTLAPLPDPMIWDDQTDANGYLGEPWEVLLDPFGEFDYGATMRAILATDQAPAGVPLAEVEYYFQCEYSSFDSGWRTVAAYPNVDDRRTYTVKIGPSGHAYQFRVKARDASDNLNETDWSGWYPAVYRDPP